MRIGPDVHELGEVATGEHHLPRVCACTSVSTADNLYYARGPCHPTADDLDKAQQAGVSDGRDDDDEAIAKGLAGGGSSEEEETSSEEEDSDSDASSSSDESVDSVARRANAPNIKHAKPPPKGKYHHPKALFKGTTSLAERHAKKDKADKAAGVTAHGVGTMAQSQQQCRRLPHRCSPLDPPVQTRARSQSKNP